MSFKIKSLIAFFFISSFAFSQEGIPVYSDYLSDNYYLIFPSMAGAANCSKLRLTVRGQWFDQTDAPALQTLSYNGRVGEKSGVGAIVFNDVNGYHSQFGFKATYAHHIMFSRDEVDLNQLSFGVNVGVNQSQLDVSEFTDTGGDLAIENDVNHASYFNLDIGASYNFFDFSLNAVVKNVLETRRELYSAEFESDNLRKYIVSGGYIFGNADKILLEPSLLYQYVDETKESSLDMNLKAYKNLEMGQLWGGLSYRKSFDGAEFSSGGGTNSQKLQYITPVLGFNYKKIMFAYTYTYLLGDIQYENGGFHQITLGYNFACKPVKYECNCPAVN
ncbi:type IX secretion system membrane protein PorP/SprF [Flavobacterium granuli]|uniref:Type IX secretion system PorP/SprF family membrane protein n=1 Tax=Flavobacterium granuli TaxID=280093 RepID=A0ABU1RZE9_9FLAO|nr:type IX secretion system membrane protein PorP/SprF [Flavobacterium granuli]MDR6844124.1 type IX secretion system PorP/SprF family membrane protein [Flavobacterium granuli]